VVEHVLLKVEYHWMTCPARQSKCPFITVCIPPISTLATVSPERLLAYASPSEYPCAVK